MPFRLSVILSTAVLLSLITSAGQTVSRVARTSDESTTRIGPGTYQMTLTAVQGGKSGNQTSGPLVIRASTCEDRSPPTGEQIENCRNLCMTPLYGWTSVDLTAVGAAVPRPESSIPAPSSRDPLYPGVLELSDCGQDPKREVQMFVIGSVLNRRDSRFGNDGPGIVVQVRHAGEGCHGGDWSEGGRGPHAAGTVRICRTK
jgi:hypothetical protein